MTGNGRKYIPNSEIIVDRFNSLLDELSENLGNNTDDHSIAKFLNYYMYGIVPRDEQVCSGRIYNFGIKGCIREINKARKKLEMPAGVDYPGISTTHDDKTGKVGYKYNEYSIAGDCGQFSGLLSETKIQESIGAVLGDLFSFGKINGFTDREFGKYTDAIILNKITKVYNDSMQTKDKVGLSKSQVSFEDFSKVVLDNIRASVCTVRQKLTDEYTVVMSELSEKQRLQREQRKAEREEQKAKDFFAQEQNVDVDEQKDDEQGVPSDVDENTRISCVVLGENDTEVMLNDISIKDLRKKYGTLCDTTQRVLFVSVADGKGQEKPLSHGIIDVFPNVKVFEMWPTVTKIEDNTFNRENISCITLRSNNAIKTFDENGKFNWDLSLATLRNDSNPNMTIVTNAIVDGKPRWSEMEYIPFMYHYGNGTLQSELQGRIFKQNPTPPEKHVLDNNDEKQTTPEQREANKNQAEEAKTNQEQTKKLSPVYPYQIDSHRSLNTGKGALLKWIIKHPVWSMILLAGTFVGIGGLITAGAMFASMKVVAASIVIGGALFCGAVQIVKQIIKKHNTRYRSLFEKDEVNKFNRKIAKTLRRMQERSKRQEELIKKEVGILDGNAKKPANPRLSKNNINQITAAHKEYMKLLDKNQKLAVKVEKLRTKMNKFAVLAETLESEIGGEDQEKIETRTNNLNEANSIIDKYIESAKQMGRLYAPDANKPKRRDGQSTENIIKYYTERHNAAGKAKLGQEDLDSALTGEIAKGVLERLNTVSEDTNSTNFEGRLDFVTRYKEARKAKREAENETRREEVRIDSQKNANNSKGGDMDNTK